MEQRYIPLESLRIASPCHASWEQMTGDDRVRHCSECNLNVYNLSAMPRREAEELVQRSESRLCIRMYKRTDGTVLTEDCPVGLRALQLAARRRMRAVMAATITIVSGILGLGATNLASRSEGNRPDAASSMDTARTQVLMGDTTGVEPPAEVPVTMGRISFPVPPPDEVPDETETTDPFEGVPQVDTLTLAEPITIDSTTTILPVDSATNLQQSRPDRPQDLPDLR